MWAAEAVAVCKRSLLRCFEEGRGVVIFIVAFHSGAVVVRSRGVGVVYVVLRHPCHCVFFIAVPSGCDAAGCSVGVALMLSASPGTASLEVSG